MLNGPAVAIKAGFLHRGDVTFGKKRNRRVIALSLSLSLLNLLLYLVIVGLVSRIVQKGRINEIAHTAVAAPRYILPARKSTTLKHFDTLKRKYFLDYCGQIDGCTLKGKKGISRTKRELNFWAAEIAKKVHTWIAHMRNLIYAPVAPQLSYVQMCKCTKSPHTPPPPKKVAHPSCRGSFREKVMSCDPSFVLAMQKE